MLIIKSPQTLRTLLDNKRKTKKVIGFVPTMGALHLGHLALIKKARRECDFVVVSIFVNPIQFAPAEDFKKYPRNLKKDFSLCKNSAVDVIFTPSSGVMFPQGYKTYINVEDLSDMLCARFRPGHFKGVATVVNKLFNIVAPDAAYFGQKDAQQALIIKKMVTDLNIPVKIIVVPTVREKDGLAMSSRNVYLTKEERKSALVLNQSLNYARKAILSGKRRPRDIIEKMRGVINKSGVGKIQYISIVDYATLKRIDKIKGNILIALAVLCGKARLIDNITVKC
jgi:pantoate--beta-alanine ligase